MERENFAMPLVERNEETGPSKNREGEYIASES